MKAKISDFINLIKEKLLRQKENKQKKEALKQLQDLDKKLVFNLTKKSKFSIPIPSIKQIKHIGRFLTSKEKIIIKLVLILIAINVILLFYFQYKDNIHTIPAQGGEYMEGLVGAPKLINPIIAQSDVDIDLSSLLFSSLLKYDKNLKLVPDIASAYEISEDQKEYTFHIKNNVFWHDGTPLTANDIIFTFNVIKDTEYNSPLYINFEGVSAEKIDDYTVKFILIEPYSPFLNALTFKIIPEHIWINVSSSQFNLAEYNIKPVGSGPYKFKSLVKDKSGNIKSYTIEIFEKYHNISPLIENITFKFYPDNTSASGAFINKTINGLSSIPNSDLQKFESSEKYNLHKLSLPQYTALFFNLGQKNAWAEKEMRQALAFGLDKNKIIENILSKNAQIINGPILPGAIGYKESIKTYEYNIEKAKSLITNQKYSLENNIFKKDGQELTLTITTIDKYDNKNVAQELQRQWAELGIKVNLEIVPFSEIKQKIKQRAYEALLYGEMIGADPDPYPFWHSTQRVDPGLNLSMFANKQADELIEQARQINLYDQRKEKYEQFSDIIDEELPAIFLYSPLYIYLQDKTVKGFDATKIITPADRFNNIFEWYIKTKRIFE